MLRQWICRCSRDWYSRSVFQLRLWCLPWSGPMSPLSRCDRRTTQKPFWHCTNALRWRGAGPRVSGRPVCCCSSSYRLPTCRKPGPETGDFATAWPHPRTAPSVLPFPDVPRARLPICMGHLPEVNILCVCVCLRELNGKSKIKCFLSWSKPVFGFLISARNWGDCNRHIVKYYKFMH